MIIESGFVKIVIQINMAKRLSKEEMKKLRSSQFDYKKTIEGNYVFDRSVWQATYAGDVLWIHKRGGDLSNELEPVVNEQIQNTMKEVKRVTAAEVLQMHITHNAWLKDITTQQQNFLVMAMEEYGSRCVIEELQKPDPNEGNEDRHPEDYCHLCGNDNPTWTCDNELFNRVNGSPDGILCPSCFSYLAKQKGILIEFRATRPDPHEVSKVMCDVCGHEWIAVRPEGVEKLECPNCGQVGNFENIKRL